MKQDQAKLVAAALKSDSAYAAADVDSLNAIARMFVAVFERELGDAGLVEVAEAFGDHAIVLFVRRSEDTSRLRLLLIMLRHARAPRGRCLAGSSRWQTPSDQRQLFHRTSPC